MTAACRYSKWSVKPSRWFVYDSMCCVGDVLIITPPCPFPNWNTAHQTVMWHMGSCTNTCYTTHRWFWCLFAHFYVPCSSNASGLQRWGAETMGDYSEDEIRLWPKTPTNILNPQSCQWRFCCFVDAEFRNTNGMKIGRKFGYGTGWPKVDRFLYPEICNGSTPMSCILQRERKFYG